MLFGTPPSAVALAQVLDSPFLVTSAPVSVPPAARPVAGPPLTSKKLIPLVGATATATVIAELLENEDETGASSEPGSGFGGDVAVGEHAQGATGDGSAGAPRDGTAEAGDTGGGSGVDAAPSEFTDPAQLPPSLSTPGTSAGPRGVQPEPGVPPSLESATPPNVPVDSVGERGARALDPAFSTVPEPQAVGLLLAGLFGVAAVTWRRDSRR